MLQKIKISILILPMVVWIGSYFVPGEIHRNSYFKEAAEIEKTILDYVEGVYGEDTSGIYKSVHPGVAKKGREYNSEKGTYGPLEEMSFEQLSSQAESRSRSSGLSGENPVKRIIVFDVQDMTATAKLTTEWGTDYFHLAKIDDKWYIMNILWQSGSLRC